MLEVELIGLVMKGSWALAATLFVLPASAAERPALPDDVMAFIERDRQTASCRLTQPKGRTRQEIIDEYLALRSSEQCAFLESERRILIERYKDNRDIMNVLALKIGFVGVETYEPDPSSK